MRSDFTKEKTISFLPSTHLTSDPLGRGALVKPHPRRPQAQRCVRGARVDRGVAGGADACVKEPGRGVSEGAGWVRGAASLHRAPPFVTDARVTFGVGQTLAKFADWGWG